MLTQEEKKIDRIATSTQSIPRWEVNDGELVLTSNCIQVYVLCRFSVHHAFGRIDVKSFAYIAREQSMRFGRNHHRKLFTYLQLGDSSSPSGEHKHWAQGG